MVRRCVGCVCLWCNLIRHLFLFSCEGTHPEDISKPDMARHHCVDLAGTGLLFTVKGPEWRLFTRKLLDVDSIRHSNYGMSVGNQQRGWGERAKGKAKWENKNRKFCSPLMP